MLDKGSSAINLKSFYYYDRMYPSQDVASSIGNLIALPLQGQALKNGNSAFVDRNWRKDTEGYICIPRGPLDNLLTSCKEAGVEYDISDHREKGRPIRVSFSGDLKMQQNLVAQHLHTFDHGVLSAATAFGKTVVCSYLIAERKVNTLILLQSKDLLEQYLYSLLRDNRINMWVKCYNKVVTGVANEV